MARRGRHNRRADVPVGPPQPGWRLHRRPFEPVRLVSDDELEAIHLASLTILRDVGMDFLHPEAIARWAAAGADVESGGPRVRFDPDLVLDLVAQAPSEFTLHAIDPANDVRIGGDHVVFTAVASAPFIADRTVGRRAGNHDDFRQLVKLSQALNAVQVHGGYPVEPVDLDPSIRHLEATRDLLTLSTKAVNGYSLGARRNRDCLEMVRIARRVDHDDLDHQPSIHTVINCSSPLRLDTPMLDGILEFSARNQVIVLTPFTLAGAMAPVTLAGALAQQNAEALAGIAFTQLVRPGSPVIYGGFTSNVDLQSGSPAFGTPEFMQSALVGGQLARRYGLPYRSSNVNASNTVDAQAGYESTFSLWGAVMGGANLVFHGAGWLEGGLQANAAKMVIDSDLIQSVATFLQPVEVDDASLAVDTVAEVGPGGHFFGTQHTLDRYRDAFFRPQVSDWSNYTSWLEGGGLTAHDRAERRVAEWLELYEPPKMDDAVRAELDDFVGRRIAEGGVGAD